jgi:hypothetical protein
LSAISISPSLTYRAEAEGLVASGQMFIVICLIQDLTLLAKKFKQIVKKFINKKGGNQYGKGQTL